MAKEKSTLEKWRPTINFVCFILVCLLTWIGYVYDVPQLVKKIFASKTKVTESRDEDLPKEEKITHIKETLVKQEPKTVEQPKNESSTEKNTDFQKIILFQNGKKNENADISGVPEFLKLRFRVDLEYSYTKKTGILQAHSQSGQFAISDSYNTVWVVKHHGKAIKWGVDIGNKTSSETIESPKPTFYLDEEKFYLEEGEDNKIYAVDTQFNRTLIKYFWFNKEQKMFVPEIKGKQLKFWGPPKTVWSIPEIIEGELLQGNQPPKPVKFNFKTQKMMRHTSYGDSWELKNAEIFICFDERTSRYMWSFVYKGIDMPLMNLKDIKLTIN